MRPRAIRRTVALLVMVATLSGVAAVVPAPAVIAAAPRATCADKPATITGTRKGEVLVGTNKRDVIAAMGGDDVIHGKGGGDIICAGAGDDTAFGAKGADKLFGGPGNDELRGAGGVDVCTQGPGTGRVIRCELPDVVQPPQPVTLQSLCLDEGGTYSEQNFPTVYNKICEVPQLPQEDWDAFRAAYLVRCQQEPGFFGMASSFAFRILNCFGSFE